MPAHRQKVSKQTADTALNILRLNPEARRNVMLLAEKIGVHPVYSYSVLRHLEDDGSIRRHRDGRRFEVEILREGFSAGSSTLEKIKQREAAEHDLGVRMRRAVGVLMRHPDARRSFDIFCGLLKEGPKHGRRLLNQLASRGKVLFHSRGMPRMRVVVIDPYFD